MGRDRAALTSAAGSGLVAFLPVVFLAILVVWPLVAVFARSFSDVDSAQLADIVTRPRIRRVVWFTAWQAGLSAVLTMIIGLPVAHVIARYRFWGRSLLRAVVVVPFVLPTVVVAAAIGAVFDRLGVGFDRSLVAVLAAHVFFNVAVVIRVVGGYWATLDHRQIEAARVLGASPLRAWITVTLRQLLPVLTGAYLLIYLFSFTSFGVIRILGGLRRATLETEIHRYAIGRQEFDVAAVLALIQILVVVILAVVTARFQRRYLSRRVEGRPIGSGDLAVEGFGRRAHLSAVLVLIAVIVGAPILVLIEQSLRVGTSYGLANYRALGSRVELLPISAADALANSLLFALVASVLASIVGLAAAWTVARGGPVGRILEAAALIPLGVSAVTLGFGYLVGLTIFDLRRSMWLVPAAHAVIGLPFVLASMVPALRSIDPRVREAAAALGASPRLVRLTVDWPLTRRALATGAGFAAAVSIGEFGATSFLGRGRETFTAPLAVFRLLSNPGPALRGQALALSVIIGVVVAILAVMLEARRQPGPSVL